MTDEGPGGRVTGILATETIHHGRVGVALHTLKRDGGDHPPLLLLHELYGTGKAWPETVTTWPGAVRALDFSGHGDSDWLAGGGYAPEVWVAEADVALARVESAERPVFVAGAGVGAYVALLLAGARAGAIAAALLLPGAGLAGGAPHPEELGREASDAWRDSIDSHGRLEGQPSPDPLVNRCAWDVRPLYYAEEFARAAGLLHVADLAEVPPWLEAAHRQGRTRRAPDGLGEALLQLARRP